MPRVLASAERRSMSSELSWSWILIVLVTLGGLVSFLKANRTSGETPQGTLPAPYRLPAGPGLNWRSATAWMGRRVYAGILHHLARQRRVPLQYLNERRPLFDHVGNQVC